MDAGADRFVDRSAFARIFDVLHQRGFEVIGPTLDQEAIHYDRIRSIDDLPAGWTDQQGPGRHHEAVTQFLEVLQDGEDLPLFRRLWLLAARAAQESHGAPRVGLRSRGVRKGSHQRPTIVAIGLSLRSLVT